MSMEFFKISTTDLTAYADIQNYKVNKEDEYEEWTDGNHIVHREIARTRISGTVKLGFYDSTSWTNFQTLLGTARNAAGYYPITVYVNNTGTTETINAFLDMTNESKWDLVNSKFWKVQTVTITQR